MKNQIPTGVGFQNTQDWLVDALVKQENSLTYQSQSKDTLPSVIAGLKRIRKSIQQRIKRDENQTYFIAQKGGKCERCLKVYHNNIYDFHHRDPKTKQFNLDRSNFARAFQPLQEETEKCHLLCANCHREVHTFLDRRFLVL
jgi:hypothetical protein